ncbi:LysR family transcriptional regulator [Acidocella sp.]|uniref:LysR family transcriptional regulator n=1 Tax=Acidocella sp. TaxID=50710 RepID=UPI003D04A1AD
MDIRTLIVVRAALKERGIRQTARHIGLASSTVSTTLSRFESAIAISLFQREGKNVVLTLEAERRAGMLSNTAEAIERLVRLSGGQGVLPPAVSMDSLSRFAVVAQQGSIRAAARHVGIGQPQLTRQIGDLERALAVPLLVRTASGVTLTEAGRQAVPLAEAIVEGWKAISEAASERFGRDTRTWRIGTAMPLGHESSIARMLANLAASWAKEQKRHPLFISDHTADELMAGLKSRRFDLVILDHVRIPREFHRQEISIAPLVLVGHDSAMPPNGDVVALLKSCKLALPSLKSGIRQEAMRYIERTIGVEDAAKIEVVEVDSIPVIINLIANHGYVSVLPQGPLARLPFDLRQIALGSDHLQRLVMVWRRSGLPEKLLYAVKRAMMGEH